MAFVALGFLMLVLEREFGVLIVIEALGRLPVACTVALLALLTQRAIVLVVLLVTGNTGRLQLFASYLVTA